MAGLLQVLDIIADLVTELNKEVTACETTKKVIKRITANLVIDIYRMTGLQEELTDVRPLPPRVETVDMCTQTDKDENPDDKDKAHVENIRLALAEVLDEGSTHEILQDKWPEDAFQRTRVVQRSFITSDTHTCVVFCKELDRTNPAHKALCGQFPTLSTGSLTGLVTTIVSSNKVADETGNTQHSERELHVCRVDEHTADTGSQEILEATRRLKEALGNASEVDVLAPKRNVYTWRKAMEIVFAKTEMTFTICTRKNLKNNPKAVGRSSPRDNFLPNISSLRDGY